MHQLRKAVLYTLYFVAVVCAQLTKSPENVAVPVGSDVTLRCAGTGLIWEEYATNTAAATTLTDSDRIAQPDQYGLTTEPTGTYDLTIKSIQLKQGGIYRCKAFADLTSQSYVQVITFSGERFLLFLP